MMTNCISSVFLLRSVNQRRLNGRLSTDQWLSATMTTVTGDLSADGHLYVGPSILLGY